jgi:hypothetical protein
LVINFELTPIGQRAHPSRIKRVEGSMHDSQRYRDNAAECLLAAQKAREPHYRQLHLSMALSWLSLARHDEALDDPLANSDTAEASRQQAATA